MRVVIAGSRSIYGPKGVQAVKDAMKASGWNFNEIISGAANGVDTIAIEVAKEQNIDHVIFPANWHRYGKSAGFKRNKKMAWYAGIFKTSEEDRLKGALLAVWNGTSSGTKNMIDLATKEGLPVYIHKVENFKDEDGESSE